MQFVDIFPNESHRASQRNVVALENSWRPLNSVPHAQGTGENIAHLKERALWSRLPGRYRSNRLDSPGSHGGRSLSANPPGSAWFSGMIVFRGNTSIPFRTSSGSMANASPGATLHDEGKAAINGLQ
jgi:hypothetical protein